MLKHRLTLATRGRFFLLLALSWAGPRAVLGAPDLEAYGRLPQVEFVRVSASGERVALIGVNGEKRQLVVAQVSGNKLLKAAGVGNNKVRNLVWAGDEHVLVFVTSTTPTLSDYVGRYELANVLHVGLSDSQPWSVFEKTDGIEHTVYGYFGAYPSEGHWAGYFAGVTLQRQRGFGEHGYVREHDYSDLYRVDLETGHAQLIGNGIGRDHNWMMAADGTVAGHSESNSGEWVLFAGAEHGKELLRKKITPTSEIGLSGLGRRPGTVLVTEQTGEVDDALEIDLATGRSESLSSEFQQTSYLYDPATGLLIGAATLDEPGVHLFDPALQKHFLATRKAFPNQQVRMESFNADLKKMIVFTEGTGDSGTYWMVDGATHRADPVGYPYPQIQPDDVGAIKMVAYPAADGLPLEGILTLPPHRDAKELPLIIFPHGGPIGVRDSLGFDWWAQAMASRGYAVFQPNYRGSSGYSSTFWRAGYGEWGGRMLSDISDGIGELVRQHIVDPKRVCIVGASYGGYAALAGVTLQHGLYRCAVSVSGISSMPLFLDYQAKMHGDNSPMVKYFRKLTGSDSGNWHKLQEISPALFATRADAPILLIHGKDDTRVPIEQSLKMASALKSANKTFEYVELAQEDHFLSRDATRLAMLKATVAFIEKNNPPR